MNLMIIISVVFMLIDQLSKYIISSTLLLGESIKIIRSVFYIIYVQNTGAAWSILEGNRIFLVLISFVALFMIYKFFLKDKNFTRIKEIGYGILIGGIFGNLIDRIIHGYVIDFISIYIGSYIFPVFNIADIGIVIGAFITIFILLKEEYNENRNTK